MTAMLDDEVAELRHANAELQQRLDAALAERDEAVEQQTATAEVLGVINSSPGDLAPVFQAILDNALRLCGAAFGNLLIYENGYYHATVGVYSDARSGEQELARAPFQPAQGAALHRIMNGESIIYIEDVRLEVAYHTSQPQFRELVDAGGYRSMIYIALHQEDRLLGAIVIFFTEITLVTDKQIELLRSFAAQAVIAMENARLMTETREALDQQTATAEVLQVINASPGDLGPVFEAILEKAHSLCAAPRGALLLDDGGLFRAVATRGLPEPFADRLRQGFPGSAYPSAPLLAGERVVHIPDLAEIDHPIARASETAGNRTLLSVPLRKREVLFGMIVAARTEVRPFTDKQIVLLENFAAQAVIAMENARLITETQEALDQQTATAEVLGVINSSPGDIIPVFDAMLERAVRLCEAHHGVMWTQDGDRFRAVALRDVPDKLAEFFRRESLPLGPDTFVGRVMRDRSPLHFADTTTEEPYHRIPIAVAGIELGGVRTLLTVPLLRDDALIGIFQLARQEVRPFSDKQIALVQNFAVQAVIAIENARLITETREALDQQTATAEVLGVINASPGDLGPVFDVMVERAAHLCEADEAAVRIFDGASLHLAATYGTDSAALEQLRALGATDLRGLYAPFARGDDIAHYEDARDTDAYRNFSSGRNRIDARGIRSWLAVALRKEGTLLGIINVHRRNVRPFTDKQIALLQNFAAQAVIAIENARLLGELRQRTGDLQESLEYQTATSDVLGVISRSGGELDVVFQTLVETAARICEADTAAVMRLQEGRFRLAAAFGVSDEWKDFVHHHPIAPERGTVTGRVALEGRVVHVEDVKADPEYTLPEAQQIGGFRTALGVPLMREGLPIGVIALGRFRVQPFTDKQIELVETFADQAVIAMENARLITETREALEQQTATAEVLQVINSSPGDLMPVFEAILDKAHALCGAERGTLFLYDGEKMKAAVAHGYSADVLEHLRAGVEIPPHHAPLFSGNHVHVPDLSKDNNATGRVVSGRGGVRTNLLVPLFRNGALLGMISCNRTEVRPFSDKEIALIANFADQAVIALENARLITETREALDQQTATAEVLGVINSSPGDLAPVWDAMLEKAMRLCEAAFGVLWTYDGGLFRAAASRGAPEAYAEFLANAPHQPGPNTAHRRLLRGSLVEHLRDVASSEDYRLGDPFPRALVDLAGGRTILAVPLRRDDTFFGDIFIYRQEVRPFSDKQIALLQNFAAQAVIAMENARLLDEIRQRQAELRVTFDNMADGVVMFDEDLRLAAWNRNFQELLDLPDAVLADRPNYADYLRILAERGEFGSDDIEAELSRRLGETDRELCLERTRPDGRVIEVRRNAVPDGGFVLIYGDITERKRSEGEIRAARDAAEAAYRDLKAAQANLVQAEKMASLGQLTAGIAHEIKNPLNFVNNFAGLSVELLDELKETTAPAVATLGDDKRAEVDETIEMLTGNLEKIAEHGRRADNIVKSMLEHSRGVSGERREVDLNQLVEEALNLAYHGARAQDQSFNITLDRNYADGLKTIELAPQEITRVFLNLFGNGFYAANKRSHENGEGAFRPTLSVATREDGGTVEVRVRDNGTGIPPDIRDKLFQPFFTTKPTGEGTGLGLSISYDIVTQQHGGTITVDSRVGEFTEFTVRLPRSDRAAPAEAAS